MKILISLLLASSLSVQASQSDINAIEQAAIQLNSSQLITLTEQTSGYEQALAYYRLAITQSLQAKAVQANQSLDLAIIELEALTKQQENNDEAWALLAQIYGLKIGYQPMKAAIYGPKSGIALGQALTLNQENPRVFLVKGISSYNTPAMYGGSKTAALKALNQAISLFEHDTSPTQWGKAETYIWRGLVNIALNNKEQALNDWHLALAIEPNYGWAKMLINQNT